MMSFFASATAEDDPERPATRAECEAAWPHVRFVTDHGDGAWDIEADWLTTLFAYDTVATFEATAETDDVAVTLRIEMADA